MRNCHCCNGTGLAPATFEDRLAVIFRKREAVFENVIRTAKNVVRILYTKNGSYWSLTAESSFDMKMTPEDLQNEIVKAVETEAAKQFPHER